MNAVQLMKFCHVQNQGHAVIRAIRENGPADFKSVIGDTQLLSLASMDNSCEFVLACIFELEKSGYGITGVLNEAKSFALAAAGHRVIH